EKSREFVFERAVFAVVPGDQRRGAAAGAGARQRHPRGFGNARIDGQAEVVVAAEIQAATTVDHHLDAVTAVDDPAQPVQIGCAQLLELLAQTRVETAGWHVLHRSGTLRHPASNAVVKPSGRLRCYTASASLISTA